MERETKEFITTKGIKVLFKTDFTGKEMREWRSLFLDYVSANPEGKVMIEEGKIKGDLLEKMESKAIELAVHSVNEETSNILEKILDLPAVDYQEIANEAMKVMGAFLESLTKKK